MIRQLVRTLLVGAAIASALVVVEIGLRAFASDRLALQVQ